MLDWQGNMIDERHRERILLADVEEDLTMAASVQICTAEANLVNQLHADNSTTN